MKKTAKFYDEAYQMIKRKVMREWDVTEDDMDDESTEGDVNRETDQRFEDKYGLEYCETQTN